ncbi:peroxidase-related enzyme [Rhabdaerophilum sp. SD176]|uniref:peroxidase-related enzyme n=1 Tax=Rhabdaerophilum sp. SD176 TaxID=2983548 RepID=UPI0024DF8EBB|nr:peroxidase-related enzyme [Rhabdaerophilum sp. SD176]
MKNTKKVDNRHRNPSEVTALDLKQAELSQQMASYFEKCIEKLGFVPNVLLAYAHAMPKLESFVSFYNELMLAPSGLSKLEREMIAVAVSAENRCWYCLVAHGAAVRQLSGRPELGEAIAFNYRVADITPRQRAMLDFAVKMCRASAEIGEPDRQTLRDHGLSDADIWDLAATASFYAMSNRMASATGMQPNPEYHGQARQKV